MGRGEKSQEVGAAWTEEVTERICHAQRRAKGTHGSTRPLKRRSPEDRAISAPDGAKVGGGLSCHPSQRGLCERICTSLQGVYKTHEHDRKHHI